MNTKLTLKLNENSILKAKEYVAKNGLSLSKLVENFFNNISLKEEKDSTQEFSYSPLVNELAGIISLPEDFDYKTDYEKYLREKYE